MTFEQAVSQMTAISVVDLEARLAQKEELTVFVGRPTCPYCQRFAPKLAQVIEETGLPVYYLQSDNMADIEAIQTFRQLYRLVTVPGLLVSREGRVRVVCDSSLSPDEIKDFVA